MISAHATVHPNVIIGKNVTIGDYAVVGSPAEIKGKNLKGGRVIIGDNTVIREHVTIHSSRHEDGWTRIGSNCYIQAHAHVGHDSQVGDNCTIACFACLGGHTVLEEWVNMGLHSVTHQRTRIGVGTILGACAFGKGVLQSWSVYVGVPARRIKENKYMIQKLLNVYPTDTDMEASDAD
tara:strand:+ start:125 stop:661 length:537 start_codon:yes stop_codon:yes gene_type:complete